MCFLQAVAEGIAKGIVEAIAQLVIFLLLLALLLNLSSLALALHIFFRKSKKAGAIFLFLLAVSFLSRQLNLLILVPLATIVLELLYLLYSHVKEKKSKV